jgi:hypothetical protein
MLLNKVKLGLKTNPKLRDVRQMLTGILEYYLRLLKLCLSKIILCRVSRYLKKLSNIQESMKNNIFIY